MRVTKTVEVDSAHRHLRHRGRCGRLHGHRWRFEISVEGPVDSETGMVVDFGDLRDVAMRYDHVALLNGEDPLCDLLEGQDQEVVRLPFDPTAENLAHRIHGEVSNGLGEGYGVHVAVWETPSNAAEWPLDQ
ncbi:MAG: hypothetical protein MAG715_00804 [Methanonatronarchaeales archaeon]|nr:hypothetical protein [Methanonatronarchaeales archaeon]